MAQTIGDNIRAAAVENPAIILHSVPSPAVPENTRPPTWRETYLNPGFTPGRPISAPRRPPPTLTTEELTKEIIPHKIPVKVILTWNGGEEWIDENNFREFLWIDEDGKNYGKLLPTEMINKRRMAERDLEGNEVYHRHGSCRIIALPELAADMPRCVLDDDEVSTLAENAIRLICGFIRDHPHRKFSLQISWNCGYARLKPEPDEGGKCKRTFHEMIRTELRKKQKKNYRDQEYIPRRDQAVFQDYDVVHDLVILDKRLELDDADKQKFCNEIIQRPALKLLLLCVSLGHDMTYLHHLLIDHNYGDDNPPKKQDRKVKCVVSFCQDHINEILKDKAKFYVRKVEADLKCHTLEIDEVMPLRSCLANSGLRALGNGTAGTVYEVYIDSVHHSDPTGDPLNCFALKKFSAERAEHFRREMQMLKVLADKPNPHIVPYYTSWTQLADHYILYPAARYNLRTFIGGSGPIGFTKDETLWFLHQLEGLVSAIEHVHHVKNPTNTEPNPEVDAYWGCHHDIKPENILVFEKFPDSHPNFKISDFGTGTFNPPANPGEHSRMTKEAKGTLTYFAPDKDRNGGVSRPFDMWALGCVYLELMAWLFRYFASSDGGFPTARFNCSAVEEKNRDDRFWTEVKTPRGEAEYKWKPAVENLMTELREVCCDKMPAFQNILTAITNLLEVNADKRWEAVDLKAHMVQTVRQAEELLKDSPNFYASQYETTLEAQRKRQASTTFLDEGALAGLESIPASASAPPYGDSMQERDDTQGEQQVGEALIRAASVTTTSPNASRSHQTQDTHVPMALNHSDLLE